MPVTHTAGRQSVWAAARPLCGRGLARRRCTKQAHAAACGTPFLGDVGLLGGRARRLCLGADGSASAKAAAPGFGVGGGGGRGSRLLSVGGAAGRRALPGQALAAGAGLLSGRAGRLSLGADRSAPAREPATECGGGGGGGQRGGVLPPPAGDDDDDYEEDGVSFSAHWSPWQRCASSYALIGSASHAEHVILFFSFWFWLVLISVPQECHCLHIQNLHEGNVLTCVWQSYILRLQSLTATQFSDVAQAARFWYTK